jgi:hypothetical protein
LQSSGSLIESVHRAIRQDAVQLVDPSSFESAEGKEPVARRRYQARPSGAEQDSLSALKRLIKRFEHHE